MFTRAELKVNPAWLSGIHLRSRWQVSRRNRLQDLALRGLMLRRAVRLQIAMRLYQIERQEPLRELSQLVPDYLPVLPGDPYATGRLGIDWRMRKSLKSGPAASRISRPPRTGIWQIAASMARPDAGIAALAILVQIDIRGVQDARAAFN